MAIILSEDRAQKEKFYPLTSTKPFSELHYGIYSVKEWWEKFSGQKVFSLETDKPELLNPIPEMKDEAVYIINSHLLPDENILNEIQNLPIGHSLKSSIHGHLAINLDKNKNIKNRILSEADSTKSYSFDCIFIEYPAEMIRHHSTVISQQFQFIKQTKKSAAISSTNNIINAENIFIEENAEVEYATLNAKEGAIYIGENAMIMEGAIIRGAFALGKNSVVKAGAKIYGAVSTGRKCTLGGEIKNTIFNHGSNKAHDGYLGDSVIGSWCNFGAGATNSNVKNTASDVSVYDYHSKKFLSAKSKKFGLLMGDYSRAAINSSINTGSSIGVCCNVFGNGLLPKMIPDFSWGIDNSDEQYEFEKAVEHINNWMAFKKEELSDREIQILKHIFERISEH